MFAILDMGRRHWRKASLLTLVPSIIGAVAATGMDTTWYWVGDIRVVPVTRERSWMDGGLGKTRYGKGDGGLQLAESHLLGYLTITDEVEIYGHLRAEAAQKTAADVIEAFVRWQPMIDDDLPLTVKAGAFFPPISLENEVLAWAGLYSITPSAINSWVGEELRTIGVEASYVWTLDAVELGLTGALFGWNDPVGTLLADRGWALHDRWTGLIEEVRLPDNFGPGGRGPVRLPLFREIDNRAGWYAGINLRSPGTGGLSVLYYDNNADPTAIDLVRAWRTQFWSVGVDLRLAPGLQMLAQAMVGKTRVDPNPQNRRDTDFHAAYVMVGYTKGDWTFGARADLFGSTEETLAARPTRFGEHGHAMTWAVSRRLDDHASVTLELLHGKSHRAQRRLFGEAVDQAGTQMQTALRIRL